METHITSFYKNRQISPPANKPVKKTGHAHEFGLAHSGTGKPAEH